MNETCMICNVLSPRHVIRYTYAYDYFFELDLCDDCYMMVLGYKSTITREDGI